MAVYKKLRYNEKGLVLKFRDPGLECLSSYQLDDTEYFTCFSRASVSLYDDVV